MTTNNTEIELIKSSAIIKQMHNVFWGVNDTSEQEKAMYTANEFLKSNDSHLWIIGSILPNGWSCVYSWNCIGIFLSEKEAISNCGINEFIARVEIGERFPAFVENLECVFWPKNNNAGSR